MPVSPQFEARRQRLRALFSLALTASALSACASGPELESSESMEESATWWRRPRRDAGTVVADAGTSWNPQDAGTSSAADAGTVSRPPELCASPLSLADVSRPTSVVGTGTAASCTESALRTALAAGGVVTFNCGAGTAVINVTQTLRAPSNVNTTLDGGDRVVLDGGGRVQILRSDSDNFRANDHVLTVQRITFRNGNDVGAGYQARNGQSVCAWGYHEGGGGAIFTRDVVLHVWGTTFENNRGPQIGPDVAGGAIYTLGAKHVVIAASTFRGNSASNGGAIGALQSSSELYNVVLENNTATGMLANFGGAVGCGVFNHDEQGGAGGLGGAFYADGFDPGDTFCGVRMTNNASNDLGGAVFRSAYWGLMPDVAQQNITWDRSTFIGNHSAKSGGGAAYVNNSLFSVRNSRFEGNVADGDTGGALMITGATVAFDNDDFVNNVAAVGGGVAHWSAGPQGWGSATSIRFSGNSPDAHAGSFPVR